MRADAPAESGRREEMMALARECATYVWQRNRALRLIAVSGSLIRAEEDGPHEDIDYFVLSRSGRIWEAFLACLWHGRRFARSRGLDRRFFCFNYLVDEGHPQEIDLRRPEYVREFLRLEVLHGWDAYAALLDRFEERCRSVDPVLYARARQRVDNGLRAEPGEAPGRDAGTSTSPALVRALLPVFKLLARGLESRRRRRYPGGYIYSSDRVIRSHFRRSWGDARLQPEDLPAARAFDALADTYDQTTVRSAANLHLRSIVHQELSPLLRPGMEVLDVGAGTGEDALWLAARGARVLALDVSDGMLRRARRRVEEAGLQDRIELRRLAAESLGELLPGQARRFDLVLADFGALNLAGEVRSWAPALARLLKQDGRLLAVMVNRLCLQELAAGLVGGNLSFALRRLRGDPMQVGGVPLPVTLYTPASFARALAGHLRPLRVRGMGLVSPPPPLEHLRPRWGAVARLLDALDRFCGPWPGLRSLGDHFIAVMAPEARPRVLRRRGAPVTASPVVSDVNGDGDLEILLAAAGLAVLDGHGRALPGWPVRRRSAFASTPAVTGPPGGRLIFAGSDDDCLHGYDFTSRRLRGFPFRTRGDVFSSPWTGDLDADGLEEIVFGSDDGGIYVVDARGRAKPGWPRRSEGYVSASPAIARGEDGQAVFIGSWDGRLYGLAADGRDLPGWPRSLGFPVWATAAIEDLDGDGRAEIVAATHRLFAFRANGEALPGFPVDLGGYAVASPAAGDLDGDGRPEIVVASERVYAFRGDGSPLDGFPVDLGSYVWASPLLVDVNGDGRPEVVVADLSGRVWALDAQGRVLPGYPLRAGRRIAAAPLAADLDGDGFLELLVATWEGRLLCYRTEARAGDPASPWPSFPRRCLPDAPLMLARDASAPAREDRPPPTWPCATPVAAAVRLAPSRPLPFRAIEVQLELQQGAATVAAGLLHYRLDGRLHPSPLLGREGRYFALVQPLPPLKRVQFFFELLSRDGARRRFPATGCFSFRVGFGLQAGSAR